MPSNNSKKRVAIKKTFEKVRILNLATPKARQEIVRAGNKQLLDCISECCLNVLNGTIPLTNAQKSKLVKHKKILRRLANEKLSVAKRKKVIQSGKGFLGALLVPAVSLLTSLLSRGIHGAREETVTSRC